jgi:hypothetical protein
LKRKRARRSWLLIGACCWKGENGGGAVQGGDPGDVPVLNRGREGARGRRRGADRQGHTVSDTKRKKKKSR